MCDPITLLVASTALSAGSSIMSGMQQAEGLEMQAEVANNDAIAEKQAAQVRAKRIRKAAARRVGTNMAQLAASGLNVDSVSADVINTETYKQGELDAIQGVNDAKDAAGRLRAKAAALNSQATQTRIAGFAGAAQSVVSAGKAAGWYGTPGGTN